MGNLALLLSQSAADPAEENHIAGLVEEARAMVRGDLPAQPRLEHLWALLTWLGGDSQSAHFDHPPF